jgi:three-Cys-motif partner protein
MGSQNYSTLKDDGLVTPEIGEWGRNKYQLVSTYASIFARSMKKKWGCRVYIDLFAGAGRSRIRGTERIVRASPLLALGVPDPFDRYIFCDQDEDKIEALKTRVQLEHPKCNAHYLCGDSNRMVDEILSRIPEASREFTVLGFCFADPYKLRSLHFATIKRLASHLMDFLILVPSWMDANRWLRSHYLDSSNRTIDDFLGSESWRDEWPRHTSSPVFDIFMTDYYGRQMEALGYQYSGIGNTQLIRSTPKNLPLYRLAFFSRHDLGNRFWREVKKLCSPQGELFG